MRRLASTNLAAGLTAAVLVSACAVGPDYVRPERSSPAGFVQAESGVYSTAEPIAEFWGGFDDPTLVRLVETALVANYDLRAALARLDQARAEGRALFRFGGHDAAVPLSSGSSPPALSSA